MCSKRIPQYNYTLIRQYNYDGTSHYIINLALESDPAAMQALDHIGVSIQFYEQDPLDIDANQFVSCMQ